MPIPTLPVRSTIKTVEVLLDVEVETQINGTCIEEVAAIESIAVGVDEPIPTVNRGVTLNDTGPLEPCALT